jgi:hypothetical protein
MIGSSGWGQRCTFQKFYDKNSLETGCLPRGDRRIGELMRWLQIVPNSADHQLCMQYLGVMKCTFLTGLSALLRCIFPPTDYWFTGQTIIVDGGQTLI